MKKTLLILIFIIISLVIFIFLFLKFYPAFGWNLNEKQKIDFTKLPNFKNWHFVNQIPTELWSNTNSWSKNIVRNILNSTNIEPIDKIPSLDIDFEKINSNTDSFTWLWHSSFIFSVDNKKILIDPVFATNISPVSFVWINRYSTTKDIYKDLVDKLPIIDAVLITHDHYDHLDYKTMLKLKDKVKHFYVPLWVWNHLEKWWIDENKITQLNWDENTLLDTIKLTLTTSRHFSWRLFDRNSTLWWWWIIKWSKNNFYISWDWWYWPHFKDIWNKYWPFDATFIEWAQYNPRWANIHMFPEESVQANIDVWWKNMILSHWWAFTLSKHSWNEPIIRALNQAKINNVNLITPKIWELVILKTDLKQLNNWWEKIN